MVINFSSGHESRANWYTRQHVLNDVLPYTCIFEQCSTPYVFYSKAKYWLAHMEREHSGRQWICYGCSPSEPRVFDDREEYLKHFKTTRQHVGIMTDSQIETLAQLNETPRPLEFKSCPLCRWTEGSDMESFIGTSLQAHIEDHVFSFGMLSLPSDAEWDSHSPISSAGSQIALTGNSELSFDLDSLSTLEFPSEPDAESARDLGSDRNSESAKSKQAQDELDDYASSGIPTLPPILAKDFSKVICGTAFGSAFYGSSLHNSRWRKVLLLSIAIASFLAAGRKRRTRFMCRFCQNISNFFENLDREVTTKSFKHHQNRQDMYISARCGCPLCRMFIKAAFGEFEEDEYEELKPAAQGDQLGSFSFVFSGEHSDKKLQMWDGCKPPKQLCDFEIYCARGKPPFVAARSCRCLRLHCY
jgi:hypothetical protein